MFLHVPANRMVGKYQKIFQFVRYSPYYSNLDHGKTSNFTEVSQGDSHKGTLQQIPSHEDHDK